MIRKLHETDPFILNNIEPDQILNHIRDISINGKTLVVTINDILFPKLFKSHGLGIQFTNPK